MFDRFANPNSSSTGSGSGNGNGRIKALPRDTASKICSGQVVVDLASVGKELVENALDAGATRVELKLTHSGMMTTTTAPFVIEVVDNGKGIAANDFENIAIKHATSKIGKYDDIDAVSSFGFRGEALSSICEIAGQFTIVTRCSEESSSPLASKLEFDRTGKVVSITQTARQPGTTVTVTNLFEHLPVRKVDFNRNFKKHFAKLLEVMQSYAVISCGVRISVTSTIDGKKNTVIATQGGPNSRLDANICSVFGADFLSRLVPVNLTVDRVVEKEIESSQESGVPAVPFDDDSISATASQEDETMATTAATTTPKAKRKPMFLINSSSEQTKSPGSSGANPATEDSTTTTAAATVATENTERVCATITGYISKLGGGMSRETDQNQLWFLNGRPVDLKKFTRTVNETWRNYELKHRPGFILDMKLPSGSYDINLTPSKREVFIAAEAAIQASLKEYLHSLWQPAKTNFSLASIADKVPAKQGRSLIPASPSPDTVPATATAATTTMKTMVLLDQNEDSVPSPPEIPKAAAFLPKQTLLPVIRSTFSTPSPPSVEARSSEKKRERELLDDVFEKDSKTNVSVEVEKEDLDEETKDRMMEHAERSLPKASKKKRKRVIDFPNQGLEALRLEIEANANEQERERELQQASKPTFQVSIELSDCEDQAQEELERVFDKADFATKAEIIGQFNLGFVIIGVNDELFILDQHACDERIRFEALQQSTVIHEQKLMRPLPVDLSAVEEEVVRNNLPVFAFNGFHFLTESPKKSQQEDDDDFDDEESVTPKPRMLLTTVPHTFATQFGPDDVRELAGVLRENPYFPSSTSAMPRIPKLGAMFASRACRSAIMVGTPLDTREMKRVVGQLASLRYPWCCAHGRPTLRYLCSRKHLPSTSSSSSSSSST